MDPLHNELRKDFQLERMILFSDAVFAIAITLLVIEIKVPELHGHEATEKALLHEVAKLIPKFLGFLVSFILISVYWVIHHRLFGFVTNYSRKLIVLNLFFLFTIVLMPFSTGIYGEYSTPRMIHLVTPFAIYVANICLTGIANFLLWNYVGNLKNKVAEEFPPNYIKQAKWRSLVVPFIFFLSVFVDFWNPYAARYMPMLIPVTMRILKRFGKEKTSIHPDQQ